MKNVEINFTDAISSEQMDEFWPNLHRNIVELETKSNQIKSNILLFHLNNETFTIINTYMYQSKYM